jgi:hypothetical protein
LATQPNFAPAQTLYSLLGLKGVAKDGDKEIEKVLATNKKDIEVSPFKLSFYSQCMISTTSPGIISKG